jgi:plasmid stabilization system protein ParE
MNVQFLTEAEQEFLEAALYYESQAKGLGKKFMDEVYQTIEYIADFPLSSAKLTENIRRKLVKRFPFGALYQIDNDTIVIIAVMNLKRKPFYWKNRIQ